eukprot:13694381-Alexandrium_andersonii.AAC.1
MLVAATLPSPLHIVADSKAAIARLRGVLRVATRSQDDYAQVCCTAPWGDNVNPNAKDADQWVIMLRAL